MPRVFKIEKSRVPHKCGKCACEIEKGQPYVYWTKRVGFGRISGVKYVRCAKSECYPKQSELTSSEFHSAWESIKENTDFSSASTVEDLESARDEAVNEATNLRDETQGKFDNMPEGLQQGDTGQLLQERIDALEEVISNLESADISFEEPDKEEDATDEEHEQAVEEALSSRLQEIAEELDGHMELSCG
jgi:Zn-dependent M32 family carboxypeptidase